MLERTAPRLYSVAAASPECSGRLPLLCKSHHSYELLPPVRHGWTEAACLHRAKKKKGGLISQCKQCAIKANNLLEVHCPCYCQLDAHCEFVRMNRQANAGC